MLTSILSSHNTPNKLIKLSFLIWLGVNVLFPAKRVQAEDCVTSSSGFFRTAGNCFCGDANYSPLAELLMDSDGYIVGETNVGRCANKSDTVCTESSLLDKRLEANTTYFFKNISTITPDYFFCQTDTFGYFYLSDRSVVNPLAYTPSSEGVPPLLETQVTVTFGGNGQGHVISSPPGIDCQSPDVCRYTFATRDIIQLTARPLGQAKFQNWGTECNNGNISPSGADVDCMVYFVDTTPPPTYTLFVEKIGEGNGIITTTGIECGIDCTEDFAKDTPLTVLAQADVNSQFMGWQNDCDGTDPVIVLVINSDKRCVAVFDVLLTADPVTDNPIPDPVLNPTPDPVIDLGSGSQNEELGQPSTTDSPIVVIDPEPRYSSTPGVGHPLIFASELGHPSTVNLTVIEIGDAPLAVSAYDLTGEAKDNFNLVEGTPPFSIPDGAAPHTLTLQCQPNTTALYQAELLLTTNDPTQRTVSYPLECVGIIPSNQSPTDIILSNDSIAEDSPSGKQIGTLSTFDPDAGDTHTYTLLDNGGGYFVLTGRILRLAQNAYLNQQQNQTHTVVVRSTDAGGLFFDKTLTIQVTAAVTFSGEIYTRADELLGNNVAIDEPEQFKFIGYIKTTPTSNHLGEKVDIIMTYHWQPQLGHRKLTVPVTLLRQVTLQETMQITLYEGHLVNLAGIFEVDLGYRLSNGQLIQGHIATAEVRPSRPPTEIQLSKHTVKENSPIGTVIGKLTTTDLDKDDWFIYDLVENPNNHFAIVGNNLTVGYGFPLDFETQQTHTIAIRSTDAAGKSVEQPFTITVENQMEANATASVRGQAGFPLLERPLTLKNTDRVSVWTQILPETSHLGQHATVQMFSEQKLVTGEIIKDSRQLAEDVVLTHQMDFMLLMGELEVGTYQLRVAYQLLEQTFTFEQTVLSFEVVEIN